MVEFKERWISEQLILGPTINTLCSLILLSLGSLIVNERKNLYLASIFFVKKKDNTKLEKVNQILVVI